MVPHQRYPNDGSSRDMEIWVPKSGKSFSQESIEEVWETWRNDTPKDECKVQLEGPEKEWWTGTEMVLWAYWFAGHVTASDGSVGTGSMGAGFVWLDRNKCQTKIGDPMRQPNGT